MNKLLWARNASFVLIGAIAIVGIVSNSHLVKAEKQPKNHKKEQFRNPETEQEQPKNLEAETIASSSLESPELPSDIGEPGSRVAAGTRGACTNRQLAAPSAEKLLALVPSYGSGDSQLIWGETISSRPTFWFYVPYLMKASGKFVLQDDTDHTIYEGPVKLTRTPGVVSYSLPSAARPLDVGKRYHWYFNVFCDPAQPAVYVEGWVKRDSLKPALRNELARATVVRRSIIYAKSGLWYDALSAAAEVQRRGIKDTQWAALLKDVGLGNVTSKALTYSPDGVTSSLRSLSSKD